MSPAFVFVGGHCLYRILSSGDSKLSRRKAELAGPTVGSGSQALELQTRLAAPPCTQDALQRLPLEPTSLEMRLYTHAHAHTHNTIKERPTSSST